MSEYTRKLLANDCIVAGLLAGDIQREGMPRGGITTREVMVACESSKDAAYKKLEGLRKLGELIRLEWRRGGKGRPIGVYYPADRTDVADLAAKMEASVPENDAAIARLLAGDIQRDGMPHGGVTTREAAGVCTSVTFNSVYLKLEGMRERGELVRLMWRRRGLGLRPIGVYYPADRADVVELTK